VLHKQHERNAGSAGLSVRMPNAVGRADELVRGLQVGHGSTLGRVNTSSAPVGSRCGWWFRVRRTLADAV